MFKRGEIVLLPFPFNDLKRAKTRPALVVSSERFNRISNAVIVLQITSNIDSGFRELNVLISDEDIERYKGTKPIIPSIVKPYVIVSINKRLVIKRIGLLKEHKMREVQKSIRAVLGLTFFF
ncbi:type II toxin-antitoxin system PemK/MazF family toxin [Thermococcus sp. JdF3]|uniref:type II toxin-antitoxin system PemK/MazF family toxin n=1 Tax=Thermococcus sp. JdF3 TaxID=1638258 RepID=UPI00143BAA93|nr:type II toxin-antitoxin system PemK/MazF family toxin [Thermococcus sp. JdF3]NJE02080.1 type II toxin-antitoxin system PemK/MazF family toxin [Thermococcus sp. JdF3]